MDGSATLTTVASSTSMNCTSESTAKAHQRRGFGPASIPETPGPIIFFSTTSTPKSVFRIPLSVRA